MPLDPEVVRLAGEPIVATIVTLMPDGQPQALPVWIDTDGEHLLVNTEPQRQRARNVARDPRVTVLLMARNNDFDWAEVRGRVVGMTGGDAARAHIDAVARKYTGADYALPIGPEGRVILRIEADKQNTMASVMAGLGVGD